MRTIDATGHFLTGRLVNALWRIRSITGRALTGARADTVRTMRTPPP